MVRTNAALKATRTLVDTGRETVILMRFFQDTDSFSRPTVRFLGTPTIDGTRYVDRNFFVFFGSGMLRTERDKKNSQGLVNRCNVAALFSVGYLALHACGAIR